MRALGVVRVACLLLALSCQTRGNKAAKVAGPEVAAESTTAGALPGLSPPDAAIGFPPDSTWVLAQSTYVAELRPWAVAGAVVLVAQRRIAPTIFDGPEPDPPTRIYVATGGRCMRSPNFETGFPRLGALDLNAEPGHPFGIKAVPKERTAWNSHPGRRFVVAAGGETLESMWAVTTRMAVDAPRSATSALFRRSLVWRKVAETEQLGVDWAFAAAVAGGVVVAERDVRASTFSAYAPPEDQTQWRLRTLDAGRAKLLLEAQGDQSACPRSQITALYGFPSGEVIATGATCDHALVVARWGRDEARASYRVVTELRTDDQGKGYDIDVVSPVLVRLRAGLGAPFELTFSQGWSVAPSMTALRQDSMLRRLARYGPRAGIDSVLVAESDVIVAGFFPSGASSNLSAVLSEAPVSERCNVSLENQL